MVADRYYSAGPILSDGPLVSKISLRPPGIERDLYLSKENLNSIKLGWLILLTLSKD